MLWICYDSPGEDRFSRSLAFDGMWQVNKIYIYYEIPNTRVSFTVYTNHNPQMFHIIN